MEPVEGLLLSLVVCVFLCFKWFGDDRAEELKEKKAADEKAKAEEEQKRRAKAQAEAEAKRRAEEQEREERRRRDEDRLRQKIEAYEREIAGIEAVQIVEGNTLSERLPFSEIVFSNITKKTNIDSIKDFVVVDVETTGLSAVSNEIVDVAAIRFRNFVPVEKFETLCFPKHGIQPEAARVNGITSEMVEGKPHFRAIAKNLQDFIGNDNLVGHNLKFDLRFIEKNGVDITAEKRKYFDTLELSKTVLKKNRYKNDGEWISGDVDDYKLSTICFALGIMNRESHRAFGDALAAGKLFEKIAVAKTS